MSSASEANKISVLNKAINELTKHLFHDAIDSSYSPDISDKDLRKGAWIASLLASSKDDSHRMKALSYGILSYKYKQNTSEEEVYENYLYVILSRLGNLPAALNLGDFTSKLNMSDSLLDLELQHEYAEHSIDTENILSRFQKEIWSAFQDEQYIAISGPTSSGKSHVIRTYIEKNLQDSESFSGIYIVPTRALISEVSSNLRSIDEELTVRTGADFRGVESGQNLFLVLTPERCQRLLEEENMNRIDPDFVFLDEFQSLEKDERGVLFENIIEEIHNIWPSVQIIAAGPYLNNPDRTLSDIIEEPSHKITTIFTPVLQLKSRLFFKKTKKRKNRTIEVSLYSPSGEKLDFQIPEPENLTSSKIQNNKKKSLPKILENYGANSQNIVYANTRNTAERWAKSVASEREKTYEEHFGGLIDFLSETIHEEYSLIKCLRKGVAYHHGRVPKVARDEIERLYRNDENLDTLICTPTLLEGVNLPAEKIFLLKPWKGRNKKHKLTKFDFQNLVGRVGRLHKNLYGAVIAIDVEDADWDNRDRLDSESSKEVTSATKQALTTKKKLVLENINKKNLSEIDDKAVRYTIILLRNKFAKSNHNMEKYLERKGLEPEEIEQIKRNLEWRIDNLEIPEKLLKRNPTIDPFRQDELYRKVRAHPESWTITLRTLKKDFWKVSRQLNRIFHFTNDDGLDINLDSKQRETENGHLKPVLMNGYDWLTGKSYRRIIEKRNAAVDDSNIDTSIREVFKTVNQDVRFVLVKYYKVLTDVLEEVAEDPPQVMLNFDQMLERGSVDFDKLNLMSQGVDRSIAITLDVPEDVDAKKYLRTNSQELPPFHRRHLENEGII